MSENSNTAPTPIIQVENLYKCYWVGRVPFPALNGVHLNMQRGEFSVIAGRSGSGKSTLLNIVGGLELADRGSVRVCDKDFLQRTKDQRALFRLEHIGFVFQAYNLVRVLTARENVAFVCQLRGKHKGECYGIADHWLAEVGLGELGHRRPDQLSGGQQQRVAVARALAMNPEIVLADEPTANLDTATGRALIALMRELNQQYGTTFMISSHDPDVIESASRVIHLADGRVVDGEEPAEPQLPPDTACRVRPPSLARRLVRALGGHRQD